jgi:hypothetical protein
MSVDHLEALVLTWARSSRRRCCRETPKTYQNLNKILGAVHCLQFLLSEETDPRGSFAVMSSEIEADIQASSMLATASFYRQASMMLDNSLILTFTSVWFSFFPAKFDRWRRGKSNPPFHRDGIMQKQILTELMRETATLRRAELEFDVVTETVHLHKELSDLAQAKGKRGLNLYLRTARVPRSSRRHFNAWSTSLTKISEIWIVLAFARCGQLFDHARHPKEKQEILSALPKRTLSRLRRLEQPRDRSSGSSGTEGEVLMNRRYRHS